MFATGYNSAAPYKDILAADVFDQFHRPDIKHKRHLLYLLTFVAGYNTDNLAVVGGNTFSGAFGYEMQSRLVAQVWTDNVKIPSLEEQNKWIKERMIDLDPFWYSSFIAASTYMDELAEIIGCRPQKEDYPEDAQYVYNMLENGGSLFPQQFRLRGPGTTEQLKAKSIESLCELSKTEFKESTATQCASSRIPFEDEEKI